MRMARALQGRLSRETGAHQLRILRLRSVSLRLVDQQRIAVSAEGNRLAIWRGVALRTRLDHLSTCGASIATTIRRHLKGHAADLQVLNARLDELNPAAVLRRGFSLLTDERGQPIISVEQSHIGARIAARLNDGTISADVAEISPRAS